MKPAGLLRRLRRLTARRGLEVEISEGKNHTKSRSAVGARLSGGISTDLKTGTLSGILKQLGLAAEDLEE